MLNVGCPIDPPAMWQELRDQQFYLVRMITNYASYYPVAFYVPMNEPDFEFNEGYYDLLQNKHMNEAIVWHDRITTMAQHFWQVSPYSHRGNFFMGLNLYSGSNPANFQDGLKWFFTGRPGIYEGLVNHSMFKVISYHSPYYDPNRDCISSEIPSLKQFHVTNFPHKACIIDADGDGGPCREQCDPFSVLYNWAKAAYEIDSTSHSTANFNSKQKSYGLPDPDDDIPCMMRINDALRDSSPL